MSSFRKNISTGTVSSTKNRAVITRGLAGERMRSCCNWQERLEERATSRGTVTAVGGMQPAKDHTARRKPRQQISHSLPPPPPSQQKKSSQSLSFVSSQHSYLFLKLSIFSSNYPLTFYLPTTLWDP